MATKRCLRVVSCDLCTRMLDLQRFVWGLIAFTSIVHVGNESVRSTRDDGHVLRSVLENALMTRAVHLKRFDAGTGT